MDPTDKFLDRVLSDVDPRALDLDAAVEIVVGQWMRATGSSLYEYRASRIPGCRYRVSIVAPDGSRMPAGEGENIVDAYRKFVAVLRGEIARASVAAE